MTDPIKATRATIPIGSIEVDGFQLPDGTYRMSQTQAAECVGRPEINARRFLSSKAIKASLGDDYTPAISSSCLGRMGSILGNCPLRINAIAYFSLSPTFMICWLHRYILTSCSATNSQRTSWGGVAYLSILPCSLPGQKFLTS